MSKLLTLHEFADRLLLYIRRRRTMLTFDELTRHFNSDRDSINAALALLATWDYRLVVRSSKGVKFVDAPDYLTSTEITYGLKTKSFGQRCYSYRTVKSTNDIAAQLAESGAAEGTLVTAEEQTRGRGRLGRVWYSAPGTGIYATLILRPKFSPDRAPGLSVMTSLALARTLGRYFAAGEVQLKWPNDILVHGRKVSGILTELVAERNKISYVLVGVGINVNHGAGHFPTELKQTATSLRRALKHKVKRVPLLQSFLVNLEKEYETYKKSNLTKSLSLLKRYSSLTGRRIEVSNGDGSIQGTAIEFDASGALILERRGQRLRIAAGEVTVKKT